MNANLDKLADLILGLINSKPRSPTKDEIMLLLMQADVLAPATEKELAWPDHYPVVTGIDPGSPEGDKTVIFPLPYKDLSPTIAILMEQVRNELNAGMFGGFPGFLYKDR